jgi:hypothetical protein
MKRFLLFILLLVIGIACFFWYRFSTAGSSNNGAKQQPVVLKRHSDHFNNQVGKLMSAYFDLKNAFVEGDSLGARINCKHFIQLLDSIPLDELKKDTASIFETVTSNINDIRMNAESLMKQGNLTEMRQDFRMVSEMMYPSFFRSINYEGPTLYLQNCPMAFGEGKEANWISNTSEIVNPYLGKNHPEYKATMLHCGEIKDSINTR